VLPRYAYFSRSSGGGAWSATVLASARAGKAASCRGDERVRTLAVRDTCAGVSALIARCYGNRGAC
jgi:hypothetical protein